MIAWQVRHYVDLSREEVYEILALRQEVFVVEQHCAYLDADGRDRCGYHLLGRDPRGVLIAYLRILDPGSRFAEPSIGRVLVRQEHRGKGLGVALMQEGMRQCARLYPGQPIRISAQQYLRRFYENLGFVCPGDGHPVDEDGIPHIEMIATPARP
jgi:ElaA protein